MLAGIEYAVQSINDDGGIEVDGKTYTFEVDSKDTQSDANTGLAYARGAVADGIKFFLPATGSTVAAGMSEFVSSEQNKAILMSASVVLGAKMTPDYVESAPGKYTFITNSGSPVFASTAVDAIAAEFGTGVKVAILMQNDPQGQFYVEALTKGFEESGQTVLDPVFFEPGATDFGPQLARLKAGSPDVLLSWYEPVQNLAALNQAVQLGVAGQGYYSTAGVAALREAIGDIPEGITFLTQPAGGIPTDDEGLPESLKPFVDGVVSTNPDLAGTAAVSAALGPYIAVVTLAQAMQDAGTTTDTDKIAEALKDVVIEDTVGTLDYNESHTITLTQSVCVVTSEPATCVVAK